MVCLTRIVIMNTEQGVLTVAGEGRVTAKPDMVSIQLGVLTTAKTARDAVSQNAERMKGVIAKLKALSVGEESLQTTGLSISPLQDEDEYSPTRGQIVGYRVEDSVVVRVDVHNASQVLDESIGAGANVVGGVRFRVREEAPYRARALKAAVHAAQHNAETVSAAMGVEVQGAKSAEVEYGGTPELFRAMLSKDAVLPIEPGIITFSASIRIAYSYNHR